MCLVIRGFMIAVLCCVSVANAQDRLESLPGYDRYKLISDNLNELAVGGRISRIKWSEDGSTLAFRRLEKDYTFNLATREMTEIAEKAEGGNDAATQKPIPQIQKPCASALSANA
jgi:hypothetical protein